MLLTVIGAVLGTILTILVSYFTRNKARIGYQTSNLKIIGNLGLNLPQDFEVTLSGEKIESLYRSQVIVWNDGKNTINRTDITKDDPLRVVLDSQTKIFNVSLVGCSREINKAEAFDVDGNEVEISFDFWDKKDGVVLDILHTESKSEPIIKGTVKGLVNGIKNRGQIEYIKKIKKPWLLLLLSLSAPLLISILIAVLFVYVFYVFKETSTDMSYLNVFISVFIGAFIASFIGFAKFFSFKKKFPRTIKFKHPE